MSTHVCVHLRGAVLFAWPCCQTPKGSATKSAVPLRGRRGVASDPLQRIAALWVVRSLLASFELRSLMLAWHTLMAIGHKSRRSEHGWRPSKHSPTMSHFVGMCRCNVDKASTDSRRILDEASIERRQSVRSLCERVSELSTMSMKRRKRQSPRECANELSIQCRQSVDKASAP